LCSAWGYTFHSRRSLLESIASGNIDTVQPFHKTLRFFLRISVEISYAQKSLNLTKFRAFASLRDGSGLQSDFDKTLLPRETRDRSDFLWVWIAGQAEGFAVSDVLTQVEQ
jgi:hypothetical protein